MTDQPPAALVVAPRRRRLGMSLLAAGLAVLLLLGAAGVWVERGVRGHPGGAAVAVTIPTGATTGRIVAILHDHGVVGDATLFRWYLRFKGAGSFQAGDYTLRRRQPFAAVVSDLKKGPAVVSHRLTIPEGFTLAQIAARVGRLAGRSADAFLQLARSGAVRSQYEPAGSNNLEGLLFPDTYDFDPRDDERAILTRLTQGLDAVAAATGLDQGAARLGLTPYQVVIVASMIEREAKVPEDRGMVARVIYNRLKSGTPLGVDATLRYGLDRPTQPLRQSDLASDSPYNTRKRAGLPPTPIASPGRAALEAALNPTPGPWQYYVLADASGRHAFLTTNAEFQRAVAECRQRGLGC